MSERASCHRVPRFTSMLPPAALAGAAAAKCRQRSTRPRSHPKAASRWPVAAEDSSDSDSGCGDGGDAISEPVSVAAAVTATSADSSGLPAASVCMWGYAAAATLRAASATVAAKVGRILLHPTPLTRLVTMPNIDRDCDVGGRGVTVNVTCRRRQHRHDNSACLCGLLSDPSSLPYLPFRRA